MTDRTDRMILIGALLISLSLLWATTAKADVTVRDLMGGLRGNQAEQVASQAFIGGAVQGILFAEIIALQKQNSHLDYKLARSLVVNRCPETTPMDIWETVEAMAIEEDSYMEVSAAYMLAVSTSVHCTPGVSN